MPVLRKSAMNTIELESMAIDMPAVAGHPNRQAFRGVLTLVDVPSETGRQRGRADIASF